MVLQNNMNEFTYDLIVIGSGPAGQRAAIQASKLAKKIALIEMKNVVGGVCTNTGTIPSKTLREAVMHLSGYEKKVFTAPLMQSSKQLPWKTCFLEQIR